MSDHQLARVLPSADAADSDLERITDLSHPIIGQPPQALDEDTDGNTFDRIEIHRRQRRHWIARRFENHLAGKTPNRSGAWRDEGSAKPRDGSIPGEDHDWTARDLRQFTPPEFPSRRDGHEGPAA